MTTYYLQKPMSPEYYMGVLNDYEYIHHELNKKNEPIDSCEAQSWVEAKQKFGFPLTSMQKTILETGFDYETMA